jgi:hypothetical protein
MRLFIQHVSVLSAFIICIFLVSAGVDKKQHIYYHKYHQTASDWDIEKWNLSDTAGEKYLLKETVDTSGRVIKLEFLEKGKSAGSLCYLANMVTFSYQGNKIMETLYSDTSLLYATDCEMHYQTIYHLDKNNFIVKVERLAKYDLNNLGGSTLQQWKEWVPEHTTVIADSSSVVDYFYYSYAKMNGIYPVAKTFRLTNDYHYGDEPERQSIVGGIKKLSKNNH